MAAPNLSAPERAALAARFESPKARLVEASVEAQVIILGLARGLRSAADGLDAVRCKIRAATAQIERVDLDRAA